jgi:hypothetical protein
MKNTVRAPRKSGKQTVSPQAQTPTPLATAPKKHYSLSLIEWTEGNPSNKIMTCGEIDLSLETLAALKRNSLKAGDYAYRGEPVFTNLLTMGLKAMVNAFPPCELEDSVAANNALLQLVAEHMELNRTDSGVSSFTGQGSGPLCFGVFKLMEMCRERLNLAAGVAS